jgi:hypothetical protein
MPAWLVLIVRLPPTPSSIRVKAWRRLRAIGAVALKNSVYLLPLSPESHEHFQWLAQEVAKDGGEATLLKVDQIENLKPADVMRLFQEARDQDYRELASRYRKVVGGLGRRPAPRALARAEAELGRLARDLERVREIDFFEAPGARDVERIREAAERKLRPAAGAPVGPALRPEDFRGRRWVTRPRPHVDRLASAWLIKRFVDPDAEFLFAAPAEFPAGAVPFDAPGVEFTHQGEACTFETLLARFGLRDRRLAELAEIVHDMDLRDERFKREEGRGLDLAIRGLLATLKDDHAVLAQGCVLFDALYAAVGVRDRSR